MEVLGRPSPDPNDQYVLAGLSSGCGKDGHATEALGAVDELMCSLSAHTIRRRVMRECGQCRIQPGLARYATPAYPGIGIVTRPQRR